jgi:hypothetical protein
VLSYIYEMPFGKGKRFLGTMPSVVNLLVSGWQVNGIATFQTGTPLINGASQNNTFIYTQSQRANNNGTSALLTGAHIWDDQLGERVPANPDGAKAPVVRKDNRKT